MNQQQLRAYLQQKGSPLAKYTGAIWRAGRRYGVDPRLIVAISGQETGFGTYGPARQIKNAWGWGPHIPFRSWQDAIDTVARGLRTGYLDQGLTTPDAIGRKWAPVGAANDPTGLNRSWSSGVNKILAEMGGMQAVATQPRQPQQRRQPRANLRHEGAMEIMRQLATTGKIDPMGLLDFAAERRAQKYGGTTRTPEKQGSSGSKVMDTVIKAAMSQLGKPYVWGGSSPSQGFDCSGLVDWAFEQAGISLGGRLTTYTARGLGKSVKGKRLKPGDMVITNNGNHMVMYIGGGKVIAAPRTGEVIQIQPLSRFNGEVVDVRRVM